MQADDKDDEAATTTIPIPISVIPYSAFYRLPVTTPHLPRIDNFSITAQECNN